MHSIHMHCYLRNGLQNFLFFPLAWQYTVAANWRFFELLPHSNTHLSSIYFCTFNNLFLYILVIIQSKTKKTPTRFVGHVYRTPTVTFLEPDRNLSIHRTSDFRQFVSTVATLFSFGFTSHTIAPRFKQIPPISCCLRFSCELTKIFNNHSTA